MKLGNLLPILTDEEMIAFEVRATIALFTYLKAKFPSDQGKYFKFLDHWGLTEENLLPLGLEVAGRNLVQIQGTKVIA